MVGHLTAQRMHLPPTNDEFVEMADYVTESFYDLLVGDFEGTYDSESS
jgi:Mg2+/Co2+ transporter CorC